MVTSKRKLFVVVFALCFACGYAVTSDGRFFDHARSDLPTMAFLAEKYPLACSVAVVVSALPAFVVVEKFKARAVAARIPFASNWVLSSYAACCGVGLGELSFVLERLLRVHLIDLFVIQHAIWFFVLGLIGLTSTVLTREVT